MNDDERRNAEMQMCTLEAARGPAQEGESKAMNDVRTPEEPTAYRSRFNCPQCGGINRNFDTDECLDCPTPVNDETPVTVRFTGEVKVPFTTDWRAREPIEVAEVVQLVQNEIGFAGVVIVDVEDWGHDER